MLKQAYNSIVGIITNLDWKIKEKDNELLGIEHPGMHMMLKKLAQHDKNNIENNSYSFGEALIRKLNTDLVGNSCF